MRRRVIIPRTGRQIGLAAILACVYFVAAKLSLRLAFFHPSATPVWPPTGIALAAFLLAGYEGWPGIFLGAFAANLTTAGTVWTSLGIASGNTLEGAVGAYLVTRYAGGRRAFDGPLNVFKFAGLAAGLSTMISATIGVTSLSLGGFAPWAEFRPIWFTWWLGDAGGALIVAPLLILWFNDPAPGRTGRDALGRLGLLGALLLGSWIVFGGVLPFGFLLIPVVVWSALQFGARDTATVVGIVAALVTWSTLRGSGPFVRPTANESLLIVQIFLAVLAMVGLPIASIEAERRRTARENAERVTAEQYARRLAEFAAERTARLQALAAALSEAVSRTQVVRAILDQGVPALDAQAGFVTTLTRNGEALELVGQVGYSEEALSRIRRISLSDPWPMADAMKTGQPLFFETDAEWRARYPHVRPAREGGAWAVVPLSTAGRRIGALSLNFATPRRFDAGERSFLGTLADQCAQALERAQLYEREHYVAETLQRAFLPASLPDLPGLTLDAAYVPGATESELGGDWYDIFQLPDGRIACSVGDVVGSGLQAAIIMGQVRQTMRAAALEDSDPSAVLQRASQVLRLTYDAAAMATAAFGILDPLALTFTYTTAGHPPPILATREGGVQPLASGGVPLGIGGPKPAPVRVASLPPGALLVLYTDGLVESKRNLAEGEQRLHAAIRSELDAASPRPAQALLDHVLGGGNAGDDVALVTISIASQPLQELALTLPAEPASLRRVRQAIRLLAQSLRLDPDTAFAVQVLLGEAANNAVEHAYGAARGTFHVRVWPDGGMLRMEVSDQGQWRPARLEDQGHGLSIMKALADSVEVDRQPSGTTVKLGIRLAPVSTPPSPAASRPSAQDAGGESPAAMSPTNGETDVGTYVPRGPFEIRRMDGVPVVVVHGDVDMTNTQELEDTLEHAARLDKRAIVISFASASFFDSKAIHSLYRFGRRLATSRRELRLVIPSGRPARRVAEVAGLTDAFPVFDSAEDATANPAAGS